MEVKEIIFHFFCFVLKWFNMSHWQSVRSVSFCVMVWRHFLCLTKGKKFENLSNNVIRWWMNNLVSLRLWDDYWWIKLNQMHFHPAQFFDSKFLETFALCFKIKAKITENCVFSTFFETTNEGIYTWTKKIEIRTTNNFNFFRRYI